MPCSSKKAVPCLKVKKAVCPVGGNITATREPKQVTHMPRQSPVSFFEVELKYLILQLFVRDMRGHHISMYIHIYLLVVGRSIVAPTVT